MLFNLLLARITILLYFSFLFLVIFDIFFIIPTVKENTRLKLAFAIPAGAPIILAKEIIDIPPIVANKTLELKSCKNNQKQQFFY